MSTSTQRTEHRGARLLALVGALVGAVYIGWRITSSMAGAQTWIAIPALAVEVVQAAEEAAAREQPASK